MHAMKQVHVVPNKLLARLKRYYRQIAKLNDKLTDLTELADELASDIGDDLLSLQAEISKKKKSS